MRRFLSHFGPLLFIAPIQGFLYGVAARPKPGARLYELAVFGFVDACLLAGGLLGYRRQLAFERELDKIRAERRRILTKLFSD